MGLVRENIEDVLKPKDEDEILYDLNKLSLDEKYDMLENLYDNWEYVVIDINKYLGDWEFTKIINELIISKYKEQ